MKRIVSAALLLMMLLAFTACNVTEQATQSPSEIPSPSATERNANPVSDFEYEVSQDGTAVTIKKYIGEATDVVIPDTIEGKPVKKIYNSAFSSSEIKSVDISDNIIGINSWAFAYCENLETVRFGVNIEYISDGAFRECSSLKEAHLPKKLDYLGDEAFYNCTSLENVFIPATLADIEQGKRWFSSFQNTYKLKNIIFEEGCQMTGNIYAFGRCFELTELVIPASVIKLYEACFLRFDSIEKVTFMGDAPEIEGEVRFIENYDAPNAKDFDYKTIKIYYNPDKEGWDTTPLKDVYTLIPIE